MIGKLSASFAPGEGGLSAAQVDGIVAGIDTEHMVEGRVAPGGDRQVAPEIRASSVQWLGDDEVPTGTFAHLWTLAVVANRERAWGFRLDGVAPKIQGTRYAAEGRQHYDWHMDWGTGPTRRRKIAMVVHLSEPGDFDGGALQLTTGGRAAQATTERGTVTVFPAFVLHRVTPVTRGVRLSAVLWALGPSFA